MELPIDPFDERALRSVAEETNAHAAQVLVGAEREEGEDREHGVPNLTPARGVR